MIQSAERHWAPVTFKDQVREAKGISIDWSHWGKLVSSSLQHGCQPIMSKDNQRPPGQPAHPNQQQGGGHQM